MKKIFLIAILFLTCFSVKAQLVIEAASADPTTIVRGPEHKIYSVNDATWRNTDNYLIAFTESYGSNVKSNKSNLVAVVVDDAFTVVKVINAAGAKNELPKFDQSIDLLIPSGGFVLVASDDSYSGRGIKRFLAEKFHVGDVVKLRNDGELITIVDLDNKFAITSSAIELDGADMLTVDSKKQVISGRIASFDAAKRNAIEAVDAKSGKKATLKIDAKGNFKGEITLPNKGVNYIDVVLKQGGKQTNITSKIFFLKQDKGDSKEIVLWVEQFPNAKVLTNDQAVAQMAIHAAAAGFTSVALDVKGPEGYASYRKNDLSKTPYYTVTKNPKKQMEDTGFDLLESIVKASRANGLKVYASFNFFTEGNITAHDCLMIEAHPDWEEMVQQPQDKGAILPVRQSARGKQAHEKGDILMLAFTNPSNKAVQDFQLLRVEEVIKNYDIDGVILDRCRYDNLYADFSDITRDSFAAYLKDNGKKLDKFPADAFVIDENGAMVKGQHYTEWLTFRSNTIKLFTDRVRSLVDKYKASKNPDLKFAAYVGSWYEVYYQNGVNWASKNFRYNERLKFAENGIYNDNYYKTSYVDNLDFLMIGTYYKTGEEVNRYITLGNILTGGDVPLIGSMSLPDLKQEQRADVFGASVKNSSGLMIFDLCYILNWIDFTDQMRKANIVK